MSGIRKLFAKDRYAVIRGSIVLVVLLTLCAILVVEALVSLGRASVEARAVDVTSRVTSQFEQMVRSSFNTIYSAAALISEDPSREEMFLSSLYEYYPYNEVGVLSDGVIRHKDGSTNAIESETAYIYSVDDVPRGRILALSDDSLLLCARIDDERDLVVRYDPEGLERMLGSSFREDYDFAVYNSITGAYLVNHTDFNSGGYYDTLLSMNAGGSTAALLHNESAIAHIHDYGGGVYITQQRSAIRPWNVSLVIPEFAANEFIWDQSWMLIAIAAMLLLVLALHALFVVLAMRRVRLDQRATREKLGERAHMLSDMAREAQVTLFIYHRGQANLMNCYDGLGLLGDSGQEERLTSLPALESACGLDSDSVERLHERLSELRRGESAELLLRGALPDREVRRLRFRLNAHATDEEVIVCSVRDGTQELLSQGRAEIENSYMDATIPHTVAVWTINVSRNLWRNIYMKDPLLLGPLAPLHKADWRDFTADMSNLLRDFIYPLDYAEHVQQMSVPNIAEAYRSGNTEFDTDYRVCSSGMDEYVWHRMHVRLYGDPDTGDILANVFVFNVDVEKNAELERGERKKVFKKSMRALSGIFYGLYYVDLDNDLCFAAKSYDGEVVTKLSAPYRETFDRYLELVHPEDREELRAMLDAFTIRRSISEGSRFLRREYRRYSGEGYRWAAVIIQPARYENGRIREVVIAMRHLASRPSGHEE